MWSAVTTSRRSSSASPPRATICSIASLAFGIVALECEDALSVAVRDRHRAALAYVDVDERLIGGDHQRPLGNLVGRECERHAGPADPRDARVDFELVVEASRREILDVVRAHD